MFVIVFSFSFTFRKKAEERMKEHEKRLSAYNSLKLKDDEKKDNDLDNNFNALRNAQMDINTAVQPYPAEGPSQNDIKPISNGIDNPAYGSDKNLTIL